MSAAQSIRDTLLSIVEDSFLPSDIAATQNMGVNLTSAIKRDGGVTIIQNQNIEVFARVMPKLVRAIRLCDAVDAEFQTLPAPREQLLLESSALPPSGDDADEDPIEECCEFLFEQGVKWEAMQDLMRARYIKYVVSKFNTRLEAASMLGVGATYLSKLAGAKRNGTSRVT